MIARGTESRRGVAGRDALWEATPSGRDRLEDTLALLRDNFAMVLDAATARLARVEFYFEELSVAHSKQLARRELLFRHSIPFLLPFEFGCTSSALSDEDVGCLSTLLLGHTLALTHMDYHLDGVFPEHGAQATAAPLSEEVAAGYMGRALLESLARSDDWCGASGVQIRSLMTEVSGFVLERMIEDAVTRYGCPDVDPQAASRYAADPRSRIMASGYWEVMFRAGAIRIGHPPEHADLEAIRALRRLRQVVDELADLEQDIAAGHFTLPLQMACADPSNYAFRDDLRHEWDLRRSSRLATTSLATESLAARVRSSAAYDAAIEVALGLAADVRDYFDRDSGDPLRRSVMVLVEIRLAWLECVAPSVRDRTVKLTTALRRETKRRPLAVVD